MERVSRMEDCVSVIRVMAVMQETEGLIVVVSVLKVWSNPSKRLDNQVPKGIHRK
jgi:hypothetical protein